MINIKIVKVKTLQEKINELEKKVNSIDKFLEESEAEAKARQNEAGGEDPFWDGVLSGLHGVRKYFEHITK